MGIDQELAELRREMLRLRESVETALAGPDLPFALTVFQAARRLGLAPEELREKVSRGEVSLTRHGMVPRSELDRLLALRGAHAGSRERERESRNRTNKALWSMAETAVRLGVVPRTLARWRTSGDLHVVKAHPRARPKVSEAEIQRLIAGGPRSPVRAASPKKRSARDEASAIRALARRGP